MRVTKTSLSQICTNVGIKIKDGKIARADADAIVLAYEEEEEIEDLDEENEEDQPDDYDAYFSPAGSLGSQISVSVNMKHIGTFKSTDEAEKALLAYLDKKNFFPNVWEVSDHGNVSKYEWSSENSEAKVVGRVATAKISGSIETFAEFWSDNGKVWFSGHGVKADITHLFSEREASTFDLISEDDPAELTLLIKYDAYAGYPATRDDPESDPEIDYTDVKLVMPNGNKIDFGDILDLGGVKDVTDSWDSLVAENINDNH
jgi:hypothetical protein